MISPETCDDGTFDNAGCNLTCNGFINGYSCSGGDVNTPSTCNDFCGDGIVTMTNPCDDKNQISGDGCSSIC